MLAKNPTRKALGDTVLGNDMIHTGTAAGEAYQFPEAASLRISFSSVKSETARRNCLFSVSGWIDCRDLGQVFERAVAAPSPGSTAIDRR